MSNLAQVGIVAGVIVALLGAGMAVYGIVLMVVGFQDASVDFSRRNQGVKFLVVGGMLIVTSTSIPSLLVMQSGHLTAIMTHLGNLVTAVGGGLAAIGALNLLMNYGDDSPSGKGTGLKQFKMGFGIAALGVTIPAMFSGIANLTGSLADTSIAFQIFAEGFGDMLFLAGLGVGVWGAVNFIEGFATDAPGAKLQGAKQLVAGFAFALFTPPIALLMFTPLSMTFLGGASAGGLISGLLTALMRMVTSVGAVMAVFALLNLISAYGSDSTSEKSHAVRMLAIGISLIPLGILLPQPLMVIATGGDTVQFLIEGVSGIIGSAAVAMGAVVVLWGFINLFESYGNDSPENKSQGIKQFMAGFAFVLVGRSLPETILFLIQLITGGGITTPIIIEMVGIVGWLIVAVGVGNALWGLIGLVESYGDDESQTNKAHGIKKFMTGGGLIAFGILITPAVTIVMTSI